MLSKYVNDDIMTTNVNRFTDDTQKKKKLWFIHRVILYFNQIDFG